MNCLVRHMAVWLAQFPIGRTMIVFQLHASSTTGFHALFCRLSVQLFNSKDACTGGLRFGHSRAFFCFHTAKDACILTEMAFVLEYFRRTPAAGCFSRCFPQSLLIAGGSMRVMRASAFSLDHPRFRTRKTGWYGCYGKSNFGRASANS